MEKEKKADKKNKNKKITSNKIGKERSTQTLENIPTEPIIPFHYGDTTYIIKRDLKFFMKNRFMALQRTMPLFSQEEEKTWNGRFDFVVIADPMLGLRNYLLEKHPSIWSSNGTNNDDATDFDTSSERSIISDEDILKYAINWINELNPKPRFVAFIGNRVFVKKHPDANEISCQESQLKYFFQLIQGISENINVICVRGEYDSTLENYKKDFGHSFYSFWCSGLLFLVLDTQLLWNKEHPEYIKQVAWLNYMLVWARDYWRCRVILLQHRPWQSKHQYGPDKDTWQAWMSLLESSGVVAVFSGFNLRETSSSQGSISFITTTSICAPLGFDPPGARIVHVTYGAVTHSFVPLKIPVLQDRTEEQTMEYSSGSSIYSINISCLLSTPSNISCI